MSGADRVKGITIYRPIIYGSTSIRLTPTERASVNPDHTHKWTVAVRSATSPPDGRNDHMVGGADDLSYFIKRVSFKLHETYPNPNRNVDKPPFEVSETGWGEFEVVIRITFIQESFEKPLTIHHHLKLHPWTVPAPSPSKPPTSSPVIEAAPLPQADGAAVHSWQYDELVFTDPPRPFLDILLGHPPTPLPKLKRKAAPPHIAHPASLVNASGSGARGTPEFTVVMEREEGERLDAATKEVVSESERMRERLIEREAVLRALREEVQKLDG